MARIRWEWTRELERANQEPEAFSSSVSHDLHGTLRAPDGFSQELLSMYREQLDEQGRHYLRRISAGAQRMGLLIEAFLGLARIGCNPRPEPVSLSELACEIL
jgi:light-regulated signal transduction histidine kinase (bacteriophytochrome)